jgi:hypothetical protein
MKFAKSDTRYWERKVGFQTPASRTFSVQIQHANRRMIIGLGTANRAQAAFEANNLRRAQGEWLGRDDGRRRGDVAEKKSDDDRRISKPCAKNLLPATTEPRRGTSHDCRRNTGREQGS